MRHFYFVGEVVVIVWNDVVASIAEEGDVPHVGVNAAPPSDDGFTIECDLASNGVEEDFTTCIAQYGYGDKVVMMVGARWASLVAFDNLLRSN